MRNQKTDLRFGGDRRANAMRSSEASSQQFPYPQIAIPNARLLLRNRPLRQLPAITARVTFFQRILQQIALHAHFHLHPLDVRILRHQRLHLRYQRGVHPAMLAAPTVKVALLIPCSRHSSGTGTPLSACFRICKICASVNLFGAAPDNYADS